MNMTYVHTYSMLQLNVVLPAQRAVQDRSMWTPCIERHHGFISFACQANIINNDCTDIGKYAEVPALGPLGFYLG
jgi:hypothetical protein